MDGGSSNGLNSSHGSPLSTDLCIDESAWYYYFRHLFITELYPKCKIDRKTETESVQEKAVEKPGYNPTHTLENRSTVSSHVNQTGRVNKSSLSNKVSCKRLNIIYFI